jgi:hypothetical protein
MLIQYLLDSTYIVLEYTNTVIHTNGKKRCSSYKKITIAIFVYGNHENVSLLLLGKVKVEGWQISFRN